MNRLPPAAEMERAYLERDAMYNGLFFLAVRTTGIFCRPTCPARKPLPKNVEYFPTARGALVAGYRPCKRCRPLEWDEQPQWASDLLAEVERDPTLRITDGDLRAKGVDPATVRRYFQRKYGMTFQAFSRARRLAGGMRRLQDGQEIDDAVFESGYESHSGFREAFARIFGDSPGRSRGQACVYLAWIRSPLGPLVTGATDEGVCFLEFADPARLESQVSSLRRRLRAPVIPGSHEHLERLREELDGYFASKLRRFTVPLTYPGTPFQERVWSRLLQIPYAETRSYSDLAAAVGSPDAVRAVGRANGQNPIAIVIPCHRVVNKGGGLGGYGGGLHRKQYLLDLERSAGA